MLSKFLATVCMIGTTLATWTPSAYQKNVDNSTYAHCDQIRTTHFHLDWIVDFNHEHVVGAVTHDLEVLEATSDVVFDSWLLEILHAEIVPTGSAQEQRKAGAKELEILGTDLTWTTDVVNPANGDALTVHLNQTFQPGEMISVRIYYRTHPDAQAFSWMKPSQTAGKVLPYMYTQCEDINCRTVAPLQDTPGNRVTYSARVLHNNTLVPKMSANQTDWFDINGTHSVTSFYNQIPIPDYLLAIAVGDLEYRSLGRRVGVITEPSQMDKVATELAELELLLDTTEAYIGDYIWGNYTVLVLPPSFPMGGMENPLLTFASPTIIVGDFSQVYVATHEIAHSWTGNSVTCANWESFWLNEGFTVFIERKVSGELHGEDFALVEAQLGNVSLWADMSYYGLDNTYSSIHPVLAGDNPDNSFSELPYEKGFQTLTYLESLVGDAEFRLFLRFWVAERLLTSVTYVDLIETWGKWVEERYINDPLKVNQILANSDWTTWLFESALPPAGTFDFSTPEGIDAENLAMAYLALNGTGRPANYADYFTFYSNLKVIFYETIAAHQSEVSIALLTQIDADYNTTADPDPEVKQRWLPIGLKIQYEPSYDAAHTWVSSMGRCKYLSPIYSALQDSGQHDLGVQWYDENLDFYHPVAITTEGRILGLISDEPQAYIQ